MRRLIKSFCFFLFALTMGIFSMIAYGYYFIPDEFSVADNADIYINDIISVSLKSNAHSVPTAKDENQNGSVAGVSLFKLFPIKESRITQTQRQYVVPGGEVFGIKLYTKGVIVIQTQDIISGGKKINPSKQAGLEIGDVILEINGNPITCISDVAAAFEGCNGKQMVLKIQRNFKETEILFTPVLSDGEARYRAGIWVRDSSAGIGTMTYYSKTSGVFAGLGHAVCDIDTGEIMPLSSGECVTARIFGCYKGNKGIAGELCGSMTDKKIGDLVLNTDMGIYGVADNIDYSAKEVPVAMKQEIKEGRAQIISTVSDGSPQYYDVEIKKIYTNSLSSSKNMLIEITDDRLIEKTGGIVQGMSGSPIIQNGMLVGAVTHVLINNPLQGYAIFAENMLNTAETISSVVQKQAS